MNAFELFAKITLDDSAYKNGIKNAKSNFQSLAESVSNGVKTVAKIGAAAIAAGAAGITALGKASIEAYAEYEQLVGGVETLFEDSADTVRKYAENAYKTSGLSANAYMNTVTSFSASLIQSLGGNTTLAAEVANRAIVDMSDNANKMGTDIGMIQNAYQGFAKQNYTMLDNLKLGYGGTQEEMKRLIKEAANMTDAQRELGLTVDENSMSFSNIVDAISVVQYSMGIAGATAQEAEHTISGSLNAMRAAWQNLVTAFSDPEQDLGTYIDRFVESVIVAKDNIIPRIREMLPRIVDGLGQLLNELGPITGELINELLPYLINGAADLVASLIVRLPGIIADFVVALKNALVRSLDEAGFSEIADKIESVFNWIVSNKETVIRALKAIGIVIATVFAVNTISSFISALSVLLNPISLLISGFVALYAACEPFRDILNQIAQYAIEVFTEIPELFSSMKANVASDMQELGILISRGWENIKSWTRNAWNAIKNFVSEFFTGIRANVASDMQELGLSISQGWENIKMWTQSAGTAIRDFVVEAFSGIRNNVARDMQELGLSISQGWNSIKAWTQSAFSNISSYISSGMSNALSTVSSVLENIKNKFISIFENVKYTVSNAINTIKGFFNFSWSLPHIELPHFYISGKFSLNPPSVPSIGVEWYRKAMDNAMILNGATIFGAMGGKLLGGGEAGREVVSGADTLMNMIKNAVREVSQTPGPMAGNTNGITIVQHIQAVPQTPVEFAAATQSYFEQARWAF